MDEILAGKIQLNSKVTLQNQILILLKRNIEAAHLHEGDKLPTEEEICRVYGVSRSTVRFAIQILEQEGIVTRIRGKGTFVGAAKVKRKSEGIYSFSRQMKELNKVPSSKFIKLQKKIASRTLAKSLQINETDMVFSISRIRCADGIPVIFETTYIPVQVLPRLSVKEIESDSLYEILKNTGGIIPHIAEETFESIVLNHKLCKILACRLESSGFYIERIAKTKDGAVVEFTKSYMRGDYCKISITLHQDQYSETDIFGEYE